MKIINEEIKEAKKRNRNHFGEEEKSKLKW